MPIQLTNQELTDVIQTLTTHLPDANFYVFGSRAKNTAKQYSDLDVLILSDQPVSLSTLSSLKEIFSESELTFKVDLVDWHRISNEFQEKIKSEWVPLLSSQGTNHAKK